MTIKTNASYTYRKAKYKVISIIEQNVLVCGEDNFVRCFDKEEFESNCKDNCVSFVVALQALCDGKRVKREQWLNDYLVIVNGEVQAFKDGNTMPWNNVHHSNLTATDWIIL